MTDWFDKLSVGGRLLLLAALVFIIPFVGWLIVTAGRLIGAH